MGAGTGTCCVGGGLGEDKAAVRPGDGTATLPSVGRGARRAVGTACSAAGGTTCSVDRGAIGAVRADYACSRGVGRWSGGGSEGHATWVVGPGSTEGARSSTKRRTYGITAMSAGHRRSGVAASICPNPARSLSTSRSRSRSRETLRETRAA